MQRAGIIYGTVILCIILDLFPGCAPSSSSQSGIQACIHPEYLHKGDSVAVISPSFALTDKALDRFLNSLALHGRLQNIRGIIVGNMRNCPKEMPYADAYEMIGEYARRWNFPTLFGLECGHGPNNLPMIIGSMVSLDVGPDGADIVFNLD